MSDLDASRLDAPSVDITTLQGRRAGIVSRGLALSIDFFVVLIGYPVIMWGIGILIGLVHFSQPTYPDLPDWLTAMIYVGWTWGYFALSWFAAGRTVGQAALGLRVLSRGRKPGRIGLLRVLLRTWVMFLTVFFVGPAWLFFAKSRLAIHDRVAHTEVVFDSVPHQAAIEVELGTGQPK